MKHSTLLWAMLYSLVFGAAYAEAAIAKRIESPDSPPEKAIKAPQDLWVVSQETDFGSSYNICVSKDAIKFASGNFVVIAKEPDWKVTLLNQKAKVFWTEPLDEFHGLSKIAKYNVKKLSPVTTKTETPKVAEQPVKISEGDCQFSKQDSEAMGFVPSKIRVSTSTKVPISAGALKVLDRIVGVEGLEGIPLEIIVPGTKHTEEILCLQTHWCLNREVDPHTFEIPKSFWKGKSFNDVETQNTTVTLRSLSKRHERPVKKN